MKISYRKVLLIIGIILLMSLSTIGGILYRQAPKEAIKIGVFLDLSGRTAFFGRSTLNGIELAAEQINSGVE